MDSTIAAHEEFTRQAMHQRDDAVIWMLWLPTFVFAHVFAGYLFLKGAMTTSPALRRFVRALFGGCASEADADASSSSSIREAAAAEALATTEAAHQQQYHLHTGSSCGSERSSRFAKDAVPQIERVALEWRRLSCRYPARGGGAGGRSRHTYVLKGVYGAAAPGEMQALMGPSGAGKSTLMDILAQRKSTGQLSGAVLVNGRPAGAAFVRQCAYVPQADNFAPVMTLDEVMRFYAGIMLPARWTQARRAARVDEVLRELGLEHARGTIVGGQVPGGPLFRGLSGGERRRLSIAAGVLAAPGVVFLDEPTTGLDAFAALTVMGFLKRLARDRGHAVIASIHQPRAAIWTMFDAVTLLSCGRLMYAGPCDGLVGWFNAAGFDYDPAVHGVVSDWALDLVAVGSHKVANCGGHHGHQDTLRDLRDVRALSAHFVARWLELHPAAAPGAAAAAAGAKAAAAAGQWQQQQQHCNNCGGGYDDGDDDDEGGFVVEAVVRPLGNHGGIGIGAAGVKSPYLQRGSGKAAIGGLAGPGSGRSSCSSGSSFGQFVGGGGAGGALRAAREGVVDDCVGCCGLAAAAAPRRPSTWAQQFWWIFVREVAMITRNPGEAAGRTLTNAWVAATMGLLYWGVGVGADALKGKINLLMNILSFFCLMPYICMSLYAADKASYLADASAKLYAPSAYYLAKVAATFPFQVVNALVFTFIVYGMAGLRAGAAAIWAHGAIATATALIAIQVMHLCAVLAPTQDVAFMVSIAWTSVQLLFNNFFIRLSDVTLSWATGLRWLSAVFFALEGAAVVEFKGVALPCGVSGSGSSGANGASGPNGSGGLDPEGAAFLRELLPNARALRLGIVQRALANPGPGCVADAGAVLQYFGFARGFGLTAGILAGYLLVLHVCTYAALIAVARRERR